MKSELARFLSCTLGMLVGLMFDASAGRLAMLSTLCTRGDRDLPYWIQLHWQQLPAMHTGMLVAGLALLPLRSGITSCARESICLSLMMLGMNLSLLMDRTPALMLTGMIVGMACGLSIARLSLNFYDDHITR